MLELQRQAEEREKKKLQRSRMFRSYQNTLRQKQRLLEEEITAKNHVNTGFRKIHSRVAGF